MNEKENNAKWWVRYAIVPIVGALLGGGGLIIFILNNLIGGISGNQLPEALSPGLPTNTPKPTVVGTPIDWIHTAVEAEAGFMMEANNISFVVDEITAYSRTRSGVQAANGYVFVVVKMRIVNNNRIVSLYGDDIILVDGHNNQYTQQFTVGFDLPEIQWVEPGQSVSGALVYNLPTPALNNSLKIRFEPDFYQTRFEVNFDPLVIQP